jgi:xanthine dehydrogenase YagR molybdenum-binding subunit
MTTFNPTRRKLLKASAAASGAVAAGPLLPDGRPEAAAIQTRSLYAGEHRMTANRLAVLDLP